MSWLKNIGDALFGEDKPETDVNNKRPKEFIIKTVLNQDLYGVPKGTPFYISKRDWRHDAPGRIMGWTRIEDFGQGNLAGGYEKKYLEYDPSNEPSYTIIVQNVRRGVNGFTHDEDDPYENIPIIKNEVVSFVIIGSYMNADDAIGRATGMAEALKIPRVEPPHFVDNLYVWCSLKDGYNGTGVKIIVQPD